MSFGITVSFELWEIVAVGTFAVLFRLAMTVRNARY